MTLALLTTLTALATDSRRPFYVIAHCANTPARVERAIEAGANGVELDVMLLDGRLFVRHGGLEPRECGARADDALALLRQVASAMQAGELALLVVDTKGTEGGAAAVGHAVGEALNTPLFTPVVERGVQRHLLANRDDYCASYHVWATAEDRARLEASLSARPTYATGAPTDRSDPYRLDALCSGSRG